MEVFESLKQEAFRYPISFGAISRWTTYLRKDEKPKGKSGLTFDFKIGQGWRWRRDAFWVETGHRHYVKIRKVLPYLDTKKKMVSQSSMQRNSERNKREVGHL